jgi:hypothetical protein
VSTGDCNGRVGGIKIEDEHASEGESDFDEANGSDAITEAGAEIDSEANNGSDDESVSRPQLGSTASHLIMEASKS